MSIMIKYINKELFFCTFLVEGIFKFYNMLNIWIYNNSIMLKIFYIFIFILLWN